jgi:Ni/Fe-hydrogenase subunit HybB-like protein
MTSFGEYRLTKGKSLLWLLFAAAIVVSLWRLFVGLGASTNLSDTTPWGLWKAWDVIVTVPLGASGFTMAFVRYMLKDERYEQIMRRSVIWAAIMYVSMGARLAFDIGIPWRIVNPLIFWGNIHSALFEVAWCVALYLIVLLVENGPRLTERIERPWAHKLEHAIHWVGPGFVLFGVLLSSMHQSSLGTLYMIAGKRLDALWYHPWLNYIYLLTAVAAGLSVTILLEAVSNKLYKTPFQTKLLSKLGAAVGVALGIAFVWRLASMFIEGTFGEVFRSDISSYLWWAEMLIGYVMPLVILARGAWRNDRRFLTWAAVGVVYGMISLRMNVVFTGMNEALGASGYWPSIAEWVSSIGWTAGTLVVFTFLAEKLPGVIGDRVKKV